MNRLELRGRLASLLGEDVNDPRDFSNDEMDRLLNDSYRAIARDAQAQEVVYSQSIDANVAEYSYPTTVDRVFRVAYDKEKLLPTTVHELDRFQADWEATAGTPQFYTLDQVEKNTVRLFKTPSDSTGTRFDAELGTTIDFNKDGITENFRFESDSATLGLVVDYTDGTNTITFAIAGSGGGSDADYGIVVDMSDTDSSTYTFPTVEHGVMVDIVEDGAVDYDSETFIATRSDVVGDNTQTTELGVVTDMDDAAGVDQYLFADDEGNITQDFLFGAEVGVLVDASNTTSDLETGEVVSWDDTEDPIVTFSSEFGIVVRVYDSEVGVIVDIEGFDEGLEVWARKDPDDMESDGDSPDLPNYIHMAIVYGAAGRALLKNSEIRNPDLAAVYTQMSHEQAAFLNSIASNRTPEKVRKMRPTRGPRVNKKFVRFPSSYPRVT